MSFITVYLAGFLGIATYYLLDSLYFKFKVQRDEKKYDEYLEYLEDTYDLDLSNL